MKSDFQRDGKTVFMTFAFDQTLDRPQIDAMARMVDSAIEHGDELRLLLDLRRTEDYEIGAVVSPAGMAASLKSIGPVKRYAVVGAPKIAEFAVETFGAILPLESRAFAADEFDQAQAWVRLPEE